MDFEEQVFDRLVKEADKVYSRMGMIGLEGWANSQNGYRNYAKQIYEIICEKNRAPSTSLFSISSSLKEEILERISKNERDKRTR